MRPHHYLPVAGAVAAPLSTSQASYDAHERAVLASRGIAPGFASTYAMGTSALYDTALAPALPAGDDLASAGHAAPADEEAKRAVRRERNRQHAVASRKRKRERVEQLQTENDGLRATQAAIAAERDALQVKLANAQQEQRALQARFERMRDRAAASEPPADVSPANVSPSRQDDSPPSSLYNFPTHPDSLSDVLPDMQPPTTPPAALVAPPPPRA